MATQDDIFDVSAALRFQPEADQFARLVEKYNELQHENNILMSLLTDAQITEYIQKISE
jgi:hypothetical protein